MVNGTVSGIIEFTAAILYVSDWFGVLSVLCGSPGSGKCMLQVLHGAILDVMRVAAVEIDFAVFLNRLLPQIIFDHVDVMRHHQESHMMMGVHMHNEIEKPGLRFGINTDGRFVQNEQIRMVDQRTGQEYTLLLTAGQLANSFLSDILNPHYLKGVLTLPLLRALDTLRIRFLLLYKPDSTTSRTVAGNKGLKAFFAGHIRCAPNP